MAVKYPFMQFYPSDWIADTRMLTLAARGAWLELILAMHLHGRADSVSGTPEMLARLIGCSEDEIMRVLEELKNNDIADVSLDCHRNVTVTCRRLQRELAERVRNTINKRNSRLSLVCHRDVTGHISEDILQNVQMVTDDKSSSTISPEPEQSGSPGRRKTVKIYFDYDGDAKIHGIDQKQIDRWEENFPALDVEAELRTMSAWLDANRKNRKKDVKRFIVNWLSHTQDRARVQKTERRQNGNDSAKPENGWEI